MHSKKLMNNRRVCWQGELDSLGIKSLGRWRPSGNRASLQHEVAVPGQGADVAGIFGFDPDRLRTKFVAGVWRHPLELISVAMEAWP